MAGALTPVFSHVVVHFVIMLCWCAKFDLPIKLWKGSSCVFACSGGLVKGLVMKGCFSSPFGAPKCQFSLVV